MPKDSKLLSFLRNWPSTKRTRLEISRCGSLLLVSNAQAQSAVFCALNCSFLCYIDSSIDCADISTTIRGADKEADAGEGERFARNVYDENAAQ